MVQTQPEGMYLKVRKSLLLAVRLAMDVLTEVELVTIAGLQKGENLYALLTMTFKISDELEVLGGTNTTTSPYNDIRKRMLSALKLAMEIFGIVGLTAVPEAKRGELVALAIKIYDELKTRESNDVTGGVAVLQLDHLRIVKDQQSETGVA